MFYQENHRFCYIKLNAYNFEIVNSKSFIILIEIQLVIQFELKI